MSEQMRKLPSRWASLFMWRQETLGRQVTADDLSIDGLPRELIPGEFDAMVTCFRHLSHPSREAALRTYYEGEVRIACDHLSMTANICRCPVNCHCQPCGLPRPKKSFTCPDCKRISYNHNDVRYEYCGACHEFK